MKTTYDGPSLPRDLKEMTPEQREAVLSYFVSLPLAELRRRQRISVAQSRAAFERKDELALGNEHVNQDLLAAAIDRKAFPAGRAAG